MGLSEQEQRMLAEIESALYAEDPKFGSAMSGKSMGMSSEGSARGFSPRVIAIIGVGLLLLIGGMALAQTSLWFLALSIVGFLAMFGAGVWALTGSNEDPKLVAVGSKGDRGAKSKKPKRQGPAGGGLEDRFRDRFQGR
ncbi:DUF3040 domain-containing protein [uncultured Corynebacterium sp.]|uniref:DUF3040 domain-containing protein n=1 Tax=uncultured Corynebacterium sp. TaxID=159447 RepID=UPI0025F0A342|nr:DUF3040 domain-containing protein [uncultured Corynebacterium sp.]